MKYIRNREDLKYGIGDVVIIDYKTLDCGKNLHYRVKNSKNRPSVIIDISEETEYDSFSFREFKYYVYVVLFENEKLKFNEDNLILANENKT